MTESHDRTLFDVTDEDRRWFESHPTLRHRVRWTDPVEVDEYAIVTRVAPPTGRLATWVTCLEPGVRARRLLAPPSTGARTDVSGRRVGRVEPPTVERDR